MRNGSNCTHVYTSQSMLALQLRVLDRITTNYDLSPIAGSTVKS